MKMASSARKSSAVDEDKAKEFYLSLYSDLIRDVAGQCRAIIRKESVELDLQYVADRVRAEGLSFLTVTLPAVAKALDRALGHGGQFVCSTLRKRRGSAVPKLFGSYFELVIDSSGLERPDSDSTAVGALRQLLYFLYKLQRPWTREQEEKCLSEFEVTDQSLPDPDRGFENLDTDNQDVIEHARNYITRIFWNFRPENIKPKHGPGAVATGELNHEKHVFKRLYESIEAEYPFTEYFVFSQAQVCDQFERIQQLEVLASPTAKVVLVPKDSRGPRLISCEPLEVQWIQGGLGAAVKEWLERHPWTRGVINFTDQEPNRNAALEGSRDGSLATLDMKEASDRVSLVLVKELFRDVPVLLRALLATRSTHTRLPNGKVVQLRKFAPMGSNLCFPIEAVCFAALAVGALVNKALGENLLLGRTPDHSGYLRTMFDQTNKFLVYGDDIIASREDYPCLLQQFPAFGLAFNADKCCTAGFFRESCGMDAHKGAVVTPLRLKSVWCHLQTTPETMQSYVALVNAAEARRYYCVADNLASHIQNVLDARKSPRVPTFYSEEPDSPQGEEVPFGVDTPWCTASIAARLGGWAFGKHISRVSSAIQYTVSLLTSNGLKWAGVSPKIRWNDKLQRAEVRLSTAAVRQITVPADDWSMVLRRFSTPSEHDAPGVYALTYRTCCQYVWIPLPDLIDQVVFTFAGGTTSSGYVRLGMPYITG